MRNKFPLLTYASILMLLIAACHKSNSGGSNSSGPLVGNWNFINMNVHTQATTNEGAGVTAVAISNYITQDNTGTIQFTNDSMVITNLAYSVDTTFTTYFYLAGVLLDSATTPISTSLPATSGTLAYTAVGSDSLFFPNGGLLPQGLTGNGQGSGATYVLSGNTLTVTSNAIDTTNGVVETGKAVITLQKQ
jgi:hypothetical protein